MLNSFYEEITHSAISLQNFGVSSFPLNQKSINGYVGIAVQDARTLLIGMQHILATVLNKERIVLNLSVPEDINTSHDFLSAMKSIHRIFFISIVTSIDAASEEICRSFFNFECRGEKAFRKAICKMPKQDKAYWNSFYEGLKIIRNACAHPNLVPLHSDAIQKLDAGGLSFLINNNDFSISCSKYLQVSEKALECLTSITQSLSTE